MRGPRGAARARTAPGLSLSPRPFAHINGPRTARERSVRTRPLFVAVGARRNHHHLSSAQSRSVWRLSDRQHWRPAFATPGTSSPVAAPSPSAPAIHMPVPATVCLSAAATDLPTDPLWPQRCKRRAPRPASDQSGMALPPKTDGQAQQPRP